MLLQIVKWAVAGWNSSSEHIWGRKKAQQNSEAVPGAVRDHGVLG